MDLVQMIKKPKLSKTGKVRRLDPRGMVRGEKTRVKNIALPVKHPLLVGCNVN